MKMKSAFYVCCIYSNALQTTFDHIKANTMNSDQTAPKGEVGSGSILFAIYPSKKYKQHARIKKVFREGVQLFFS